MDNQILIDIINLCLSIEKKAEETYLKFSFLTQDDDLKAFWQRMAGEENKHIAFWIKTLKLSKQGMNSQVFDNPPQVKEQLENILPKCNKILENSKKFKRIPDTFLLAYRMEYYLLHPAFETLFHFISTISNEPTPADYYEAHLNRFIEALGKFGVSSPELELLAETIKSLWKEIRILGIQNTNDYLTGVLNRKGFFDSTQSLSHLAQRNKHNVAIMMIDIDYFKQVNDSYGHPAGDAVLKSVADLIKNQIRKSDIVGRFGGEEFIVFLSSIDRESLNELAEKIRYYVEKETKQNIPVTISIGASQKTIEPDVEKEIETLIKKADECLYQAKNKGRNKVVLYNATRTNPVRDYGNE